MKTISINKFGKSFAPATVVAGYVFIVIGIATLFSSYIAGIILMIIGIIIAFSYFGVMLNSNTKEYKEYNSICGIRIGSWKSYDGFPQMSVLRNKVVTNAFSRSNRSANTSSDIVYDICLLSSNHRQKVVIQKAKDETKSIQEANELAKILGVELSTYKPVLSAKTQTMRDNRK